MRKTIQATRVEAFKAYRDEVSSGVFPAQDHLVDVDNEVLQTFRELTEHGVGGKSAD